MVTRKAGRKTFSPNLPNNHTDVLTTIATLRTFGQNFLSTADYLEATVKIGASHGIAAVARTETSPRRVLSVTARRKIAMAQKKRWAKNRTQPGNVATMTKGKQTAAVA